MKEAASAPETRFKWGRTVVATIIVGVSLWFTWVTQEMPTMCPAVYPAPASCMPEARLVPAIWGTVLISVLFLALLTVDTMVRSERKVVVLRWLMVALGVAAVIVPLWTLFSSGFGFVFGL